MIVNVMDIAGLWIDGKIKGNGCATSGDFERGNQKDLILNSTVEEAETEDGDVLYYYCDFCGLRLEHCGDARYE